jgi:hypothetical protein
MITVDEIFDDPDLVQPFTITRALRVRDTSGAPVELPNTVIQAYGVVQPAPVETRARYTPEGEREDTMCVVWTKTLLQCGVNGQAADVVTYNGRDYRVNEVTFWKHEGGFYKATCTQVNL